MPAETMSSREAQTFPLPVADEGSGAEQEETGSIAKRFASETTMFLTGNQITAAIRISPAGSAGASSCG